MKHLPVLLLVLWTIPAAGQVPAPHPASRDSLRDDRGFSFYDGRYRPDVPRPDLLLGYEIGQWHTPYEQQQRVLLTIAAAAGDRVRVEEIGITPEKRTMRIFIVSSPQNVARLDAIRSDLERLGDPRGASDQELRTVAARTPAVVMFSGSVHGDEVPGYEASMPLLYHLAASEDAATVSALEKAIVIINPSSNPDGHERFAVWYNSIALGSPEPDAMEHQLKQPWSIYGRYNHYRFDMNRDVFASTQPEVQAILRAIRRWHPVVHVDLHGYTEQYHFAPPAKPVNPHVPEESGRWFEAIGRGNASAFDRYGWHYFARDIFDLYYPGYWDTWPSLIGATGMTYETDGGPAFIKRRDDGTILSLRDGIAKHYVASLATLGTIAEQASDRVADYLAFRRSAVDAGRRGVMKRVVWVDGDDPVRSAELAAMLLRNGIEVRRTNAAFEARRARTYPSESITSKRFEPGAYVVDLAQPHGRLARTLLELNPDMDSTFARVQLEKFARNRERGEKGYREDYEFYDVTAWSLPVAFGVDAYRLEDAVDIDATLLRLPDEPSALPVAVTSGVIRGKGATSAYLFRNERQSASRLAAALLNEDFRVAISSEPMDVGGEIWPRGTFVVRVSRNKPALHDRIEALARDAKVEVVGVDTAFPMQGQFSTGSESVVSLKRPRILVVGGEGIDQTGYGALWWTLEQRYRIPFTAVSAELLQKAELSTYDVVIIPPSSPSALQSDLGKGAALREWVQNGGTLIGLEGAAAWAAGDSVNFTSARLLRPEEEKEKKPAPPATAATDTAIGVKSPSATDDRPESLPGSFFDVVLDRTHWLTLGMDEARMTVLLMGSTFLRPSAEGSNVAVFSPEGTLHRAGFVWPDNTERLLRGTSLIIEEPLGEGHVILFANDPVFRGWWRSLDKVLLNAILLGSGF